MTQPRRPPKKVCSVCGESYINAGAHAEACRELRDPTYLRENIIPAARAALKDHE